MIDIKCPKCSRLFHVKDDFRGAVVECGSCGVIFEVPTTGSVGLLAAAVPNISVVCPGCRTTHQVPGNARGLEAECMVCKRSFRIPESDAKPGVPAPAAAALRPAMPAKPGKASDFGDTSTIRLTRSNAKFRDNTMAPVPPPASDGPRPNAPAAAVPMSKPVPQQFPPPAPAAAPAPAPVPAAAPRPVAPPAPPPRPTAPSSPPPPTAAARSAASASRRESEQSQRVLGRIPAFHLEPDEEILDSKEGTASGLKNRRFLFALPVLVIWGVAFLSWALTFLIPTRMSWIFPLMFSIIGSLSWILLAAGPLLGGRNRLWLVVTDKRVVMGSGKDTLTINRTG